MHKSLVSLSIWGEETALQGGISPLGKNAACQHGCACRHEEGQQSFSIELCENNANLDLQICR
jgi:hypothetical protein